MTLHQTQEQPVILSNQFLATFQLTIYNEHIQYLFVKFCTTLVSKKKFNLIFLLLNCFLNTTIRPWRHW